MEQLPIRRNAPCTWGRIRVNCGVGWTCNDKRGVFRQVRVIRVDAKSRKVDLSQRSEEERAADKKLAEKGAGTVKVAGMNQLQAALARAGIQKNDFVDLSKVRQYRCVQP